MIKKAVARLKTLVMIKLAKAPLKSPLMINKVEAPLTILATKKLVEVKLKDLMKSP